MSTKGVLVIRTHAYSIYLKNDCLEFFLVKHWIKVTLADQVAAVAWVPPLAWEHLHAADVIQKKKKKRLFFDFLLLLLFFLGPHLRHMEVPRLGVKLELQLLAYATATWQRWIEPTSSRIIVWFLTC